MLWANYISLGFKSLLLHNIIGLDSICFGPITDPLKHSFLVHLDHFSETHLDQVKDLCWTRFEALQRSAIGLKETNAGAYFYLV